MRILGIDPGFGRTGFGAVTFAGTEPKYDWHDCLETSAKDDFPVRLMAVRDAVRDAIVRFRPQAVAVEKLFFQTNVKTAIDVGMARGVILLAIADAGLPLVELTPNEVKQAVAGYGSADKKQIQDMVRRLLRLKEVPKPDDAADALAIAIAGGLTHITRLRFM